MKRYMLALLLSASLPVVAMEEADKNEEQQDSKSLCAYLGNKVEKHANGGLNKLKEFANEYDIPDHVRKTKEGFLEFLAEHMTWSWMGDEKPSVSSEEQSEQNEVIVDLENQVKKLKQELEDLALAYKLQSEDQQQ